MLEAEIELERVLGIESTLEVRGAKYGDFGEQAKTIQALKAVMSDTPNWETLPAHKKQALEMIAMKQARILHGDPDYADSWVDIEGYARLGLV